MVQLTQYWRKFHDVGGEATDAGQPGVFWLSAYSYEPFLCKIKKSKGYRQILLNGKVLISLVTWKTKQNGSC